MRLGADLLALEKNVGDREDDDHGRDEAGQLRPDQEEALRRRQRRAEQGPLDLAVKHRAEGAGRRLQQREGDLGVKRVGRNPVDYLGSVQIGEVGAEDAYRADRRSALPTTGVMTDQNSANNSHMPSAASAAVAGARNTTENSIAIASHTPP